MNFHFSLSHFLQEFCKIYRQFFPFGDPSDFASYMFQMFDTNQSGMVDFKEFAVALSTTSQGTLQDKLQCEFSAFCTVHSRPDQFLISA